MDADKLANLIIRHHIAAQGLNAADAAKIVRLLNSADDDLMEKIAARYAAIRSKGFDRGPATTKRLEDMLEAIRAVNADVYAKVGEAATDNLVEVARAEAEFIAKASVAAGGVDISSTIPDTNFLRTLVTTTPIPADLNGSSLLRPWLEGLEEGRMRRLEGAIRLGLLQGETTDDLVKRIRGTKAAAYQDGLLNVSRHSAQTFAITANSTVQNAARTETYKAMKTIRYVEWSSILDGRTTPICQSLSGTIYALDDPHPTPPRHPRCRSILLPRRNNTDPPKHKPYGEWLRSQPAGVQDEVLGKARAEVFRANPDADFKELFRDNGTYRTLDELREFDAALFDE